MENPLEFMRFYLQEKSKYWEIVTAQKDYIDMYGRPVHKGETYLLKANTYPHTCISQISARQWLQDLIQDTNTFKALQGRYKQTLKTD